MPSKSAQVMLAIEQDIRARDLKPGDAYQSAREVARMLDVSPMTADRAMRKMADSGLLERRHGSGTFVGAGIDAKYTARSFQVWVPSDFFNLYSVVVERIVKFIHHEFPGDAIQQMFLPEEGQVAFCERMAATWDDLTRPRTLVLVACSKGVQQLMNEFPVPAVAIGSVHKDSCSIPWIDMDYRQAGHLLSEYMVRRGHERILVLMDRLWGPGDNEFLEGIEQGIKSVGNANVDTRVRSVKEEHGAIEQHLRRALRAGNPPTALLCSSKATAEFVVEVADGLGLNVPEDFLVGTVRARTPEYPGCRYAYVRWAVVRESGTVFCSMVRQINQGVTVDPENYLTPVELEEPDALKAP
jgi:DNA-binding transcriptional regulator YhcF (GntR family)